MAALKSIVILFSLLGLSAPQVCACQAATSGGKKVCCCMGGQCHCAAGKSKQICRMFKPNDIRLQPNLASLDAPAICALTPRTQSAVCRPVLAHADPEWNVGPPSDLFHLSCLLTI
jgi:hypothetical protein